LSCVFEVGVVTVGSRQFAKRIAHKLRPAAAADKINPFPITRPPRAYSFMHWLGGAAYNLLQASSTLAPSLEQLADRLNHELRLLVMNVVSAAFRDNQFTRWRQGGQVCLQRLAELLAAPTLIGRPARGHLISSEGRPARHYDDRSRERARRTGKFLEDRLDVEALRTERAHAGSGGTLLWGEKSIDGGKLALMGGIHQHDTRHIARIRCREETDECATE
jgi:hypothetical protein